MREQHESCKSSPDILTEKSLKSDTRVPGGLPGDELIAVVGMACRFPGADSVSAFWRFLEEGKNAVVEGVPGSGVGRLGGLFPEAVQSSACRFGAFLDGIDQFDADFFRISPIEADLLDPQQRLMLETSWQAVENAAIDPARLKGSRTGVYAGISNMDYRGIILESGEPTDPAASLYTLSGTYMNTAIGRVSFSLGLEGPTFAVDTACSSSLVAVHQAVTGLQRGEADLALAGGVQLILEGKKFEYLAVSGMLSPDGQCKAFDESANGFVRGEGCGIVVLKRLSDAEADGDRIWGVIRGSAINHDGAAAGLTVPNGLSQQRVIEEALSRAGVAPADVDYLEAHGTGTEVGDPIELNAAATIYGRGREQNRPLFVGSVKTNIGHLEAVSGVAGLIKTILAMKRGIIPKHLHFRNPNPLVDWENLPVRITSEPTEWPAHPERPPLASVSAYGVSGTNAHVVVEGYGPFAEESEWTAADHWVEGAGQRLSGDLPEAPKANYTPGETSKKRYARMLALSGKSDGALRDLAQRYLSQMDHHTEMLPPQDQGEALADMAWTSGVGRSHFPYRAAAVFRDVSSLRQRLKELLATEQSSEARTPSRVAFLFAGQGSQWAGMGKALYESEPVFRAVLDQCEGVFREERSDSLLDVMFGDGGGEGDLDDTEWNQPALYALECALTALWASIGIRPQVVAGHSLGEFAAAHAAGAFSLEEGMRIVTKRATLMADLEKGAMAAVFAPRQQVMPAVEEFNSLHGGIELSVAVDNGTHQVVSGQPDKVEAISKLFELEGTRVRRLRTRQGSHSPLIEPALDQLEEMLRENAISSLSTPFVSGVTGQSVEPGHILDAAYWRGQARLPVAFADTIRTLAEEEVDVVVEIGPHAVLGPIASLNWPDSVRGAPVRPPAVLFSLLRPGGDETESGMEFADAVAAAYQAGLDISFEGLFAGERRRRVSVPGYPFQRRRFWYEASKRRRTDAGHPLLGIRHESARGEIMFENDLSGSHPSWLRDHRVFGRVLAPGAMYGAMAASAVPIGEHSNVFVRDFQLHSPLIFRETEEDNGRQIQVILDPAGETPFQHIEIFSKGKLEAWVLHAEGSVELGAKTQETGSAVDPEGLRSGMSPVDVSTLYRTRSSYGIDYGPAFRSLRAVWARKGQAMGEIALPEGFGSTGMDVHPILLDGCFQTISVARHGASWDDTATYLPFGWEKLSLHGPLPERLLCHVEIRDSSVPSNESSEPPEFFTADLWFYDLDGTDLGSIAGLTVKRATHVSLLSAVEELNDLIYQVVWRELPMPVGTSDAAEVPGSWILAPDSGGVGAMLADALTTRNQVVASVSNDIADQRESWQSAVKGLPENVPLRGIVHLRSLDAHGTGATAEELMEDVTRAAGSGLAMLQGVLDIDATPSAGVWFVTRGAQVLEGEQTGEPSGATLWGLGRVAGREAPWLQPRIVDLDPDEAGLPEYLVDELLCPDSETHIAFRAGTRSSARLVRCRRQPLGNEHLPSQVRDDRTYLITGGLGGIGCAAAGWLAARGAGAIVLNGRRPPDPEAEDVIAALREGGATVQVELADVTDEVAVNNMLSRIASSLPPLGGVIHSVGVLEDASLQNQSWASFERVLWPKVLGAWHLHHATQGLDLDMFLLFSSMSGVRGNPGQANYAAANAFLDQLASHRSALGLPGQVIQWGAWSGVGEAEEQRERIAGVLATSGAGWISPQQGMEALDRLVGQGPVSCGVSSIDWNAFAAVSPLSIPFFEELATVPLPAASSSEFLVSPLLGLPPAEREQQLTAYLQRELQALMRLPSAPSPSVGFFDLGMDSLMAVEFRNRLNRAFSSRYTAPNTIVFDYPDTARLAHHLAEELGKLESPAPNPEKGPISRRPQTEQDGDDIAIIGMACRFPGAADLEHFWSLLEEGRNAVTDGRKGAASWQGFMGDPDATDSLFRRGAFVEGLEEFDARFFRIAPIEAENMDPQQQLLLETSWHALVDAGLDPDRLSGSRTGVYAGIGASEKRIVLAATGKNVSYLATSASMSVGRIAYELGLEGPAMPVDLACASSLVAVHHAVAALCRGEVDLALAGGANAILSPAVTRELANFGLLSSSGQCRPFDEEADGYVRGEGCGVIVLKRLAQAKADGDRIWAFIRGSATNQNGASAGLTIPNGPAQQRVIEEALLQAGVSPADIDYLEAHAVGSRLADPIEIQAAAAVYGRGRELERPLLVGSVKTNIGHLEAASGIASLIKTVLAMRKGFIPKHLNLRSPNSYLEWDTLPVEVVSEAVEWPLSSERGRLAGVSAFGISGTNAHVVLEG